MKTNADVISGMLLVVLGTSAALYSAMTLKLGDAGRMGPGAFPAVSGLVLACLGVAIALPAVRRMPRNLDVSGFRLACICAGMVGFAYIIPAFGLVPAISWLTFASIFASGRFRLVRGLVMSVVLTAIAYVVFVIGFEANIPLVDWPQP